MYFHTNNSLNNFTYFLCVNKYLVLDLLFIKIKIYFISGEICSMCDFILNVIRSYLRNVLYILLVNYRHRCYPTSCCSFARMGWVGMG